MTTKSSRSGRFVTPNPLPCDLKFGTWQPFQWDNDGKSQHGIRLVPVEAPWRRLIAWLDEEAIEEPSEPVSEHDESDAILACCWRYGSYTHVLTAGESFAPFGADKGLSRIDDSEMMRINLEFSSGVEAWLATRTMDPGRIWRRVRLVHRTLPVPWRTDRPQEPEPLWQLELQRHWKRLDERINEQLQSNVGGREFATISERREANHLVNWIYRNGPVEDIHAGKWSLGSEVPGYKRLYAKDIVRIGRFASWRLADYLSARRVMVEESRRVMVFANAGMSGSGWSEDEETAPVRFLGMPGDPPLQERLDHLAPHWPGVYGRSTWGWE